MRIVAVLLAVIGLPVQAQEVRKSVENPQSPVVVRAQAAPGSDEREKTAGQLGLVLKDGIAGTEEGHAISELQYWIGYEDYDLAEAAYRISCRQIQSPSVRFVRAWSLLRWAIVGKKGYSRALTAFEEVQASDPVLREHVAALVQSLRAAMPCVGCDGKGRIRCIRCHGTGAIDSPADGIEKAPCDSCERGERKCSKCAGPRALPELNDICRSALCGTCEGRGLLFKNVRWACTECRGLGQKLTPKADSGKILR